MLQYFETSHYLLLFIHVTLSVSLYKGPTTLLLEILKLFPWKYEYDKFPLIQANENGYSIYTLTIFVYFSYIGDCQIMTACQDFVNTHGEDILRKNLYRNFKLHMINLFDFSLIKPEEVHKTLAKLEEIKINSVMS